MLVAAAANVAAATMYYVQCINKLEEFSIKNEVMKNEQNQLNLYYGEST